MLRAMQGRRWDLTPHAIRANATGASVDANLFDMPDGAQLAVLLLRGNGAAAPVKVTVSLLRSPVKAEALLETGRAAAWTGVAPAAIRDGAVTLSVTGTIAMLRLHHEHR